MTDHHAILEVALAEARAGMEEGGIPIGGALFDSAGALLGSGRNQRVQRDDPSAHGETEAFRNAGHVWDLERTLHLPGEGAVQSVLLHSQTLVQVANTYYATVHFPATLLFLLWLYRWRPRHYVWSRRILAALTGAALALHLLFPLAPPRMLPPAGLIDTGQVYGPTVYGDTPATDSMANQFAAMPSLHFGWSLWCGVAIAIIAPRMWMKALGLLHPLFTVSAIVATGNHWVLDAVGGAAVVAAGFAGTRREPV